MTKRKLVKSAKEAQLHAGQYAYGGRRKKKSNFRRLWISRISNKVKNDGINYSQFQHMMKKAGIGLDRKILAYLILNDENAFQALLDKIRKN